MSARPRGAVGTALLVAASCVAAGARGTSYRRIATADDAGVAHDQGEPGPMLLSPDGSTVAVGGRGGGGHLATVSLEDGSVRSWSMPDGRSTVPMARSGDGRSVFVGTVEGDIDRYASLDPRAPFVAEDVHRVVVDGPEQGEAGRLPGLAGVSGIAPLPQDDGLLVTAREGTALRSADGMEVVVDDVGLGAGTGAALRHTAISPDGGRVVTGGEGWITVSALREGTVSGSEVLDLAALVEEDGSGRTTDALGWLSPDQVLVSTYDNQTTSSRLHLWSVDAGTGEALELLVAEPGWTGAAIAEISVAGDLLDGAVVGDPGRVDRGRSSLLRVIMWAGVGLLALLALLAVGRGVRTFRLRPSDDQ